MDRVSAERNGAAQAVHADGAAVVDVSGLPFISDTTQFARETYSRILNRQPSDADVWEVARTIDSGISKAYIVFCIVNSAEAMRRGVEFHGYSKPLPAPDLARLRGAPLVRAAFRSILWREPKSEELYGFLKSLSRSGRSGQVVLELSQTPEASRYPALEGLDELRPRELSALLSIPEDTAFLNDAYESILARPADPGGLRTHLASLRRHSRSRVLCAIAMSPEAQSGWRQFLLNGRLIAEGSGVISRRRGFRDLVAAMIARCANLLLSGLQPRFASIESRQDVLVETLAAIEERTGDALSSALDRHAAQVGVEFKSAEAARQRLESSLNRQRAEDVAATSRLQRSAAAQSQQLQDLNRFTTEKLAALSAQVAAQGRSFLSATGYWSLSSMDLRCYCPPTMSRSPCILALAAMSTLGWSTFFIESFNPA